ncbi:hypothetical protein FJY84_06405, partial [Candidatus Bathyarchaeota archaeon]|nr:hypothetical protein [Candidatus Bathyarchaeota archaeon]
MNRENVYVNRITKNIESVEGDLLVENGVVDAVKGSINVNGITKCDGDCTFHGSLTTVSLDSKAGTVTVTGDLLSSKNVHVKDDLFI